LKGKKHCIRCHRELSVGGRQCTVRIVNSPLSIQLKAPAVIMTALASRCERDSRRYHEKTWVGMKIPTRVVPRKL